MWTFHQGCLPTRENVCCSVNMSLLHAGSGEFPIIFMIDAGFHHAVGPHLLSSADLHRLSTGDLRPGGQGSSMYSCLLYPVVRGAMDMAQCKTEDCSFQDVAEYLGPDGRRYDRVDALSASISGRFMSKCSCSDKDLIAFTGSRRCSTPASATCSTHLPCFGT